MSDKEMWSRVIKTTGISMMAVSLAFAMVSFAIIIHDPLIFKSIWPLLLLVYFIFAAVLAWDNYRYYRND
jgi:glucan phosphoethanolaminetransferase (alkaline phosphatase superfamily)